MGLFTPRRPAIDGRPRELRAATPLIAADDQVVHVAMVVRFDPRPPPDQPGVPAAALAPEWRPDDDVAVRAVALTALRLHAQQRSSADLLVDRTGVIGAVQGALSVAPGPRGYDTRVTEIELSREEGTPPGLLVRVLEQP